MEYTVRYAKVKHGYARIGADGKLNLTIPNRLKNNKKFELELAQKGQKLLQKISKKTQIRGIDGEYIFLFGEKVDKSEVLSAYQGNRRKEEYKIQDFLKTTLFEYSEPILQEISQKIGKKYSELNIKSLKSKRGSCSHDQKILLNQVLVHLPTKYIFYVIVHEACHLKVKNHSYKFWDLVEKYCPEYKQIRREMREFMISNLG